MFIIVVGGGKLGYYLIKDLINSGQETVLIEKDKKKTDRLSEALGSMVINGDGCDPSVLQEAGIERSDMIVAITGDDEDNLVICQVAKNKFNVPFAIARVNNPKNEEIFKKLGIDATISSTNLILNLIEQEVAYKGVLTILPIQKRIGIEIVEMTLTKNSPAVNKAIKGLNIPSECIIAGVVRDDKWIIPDGNFVLQVNDLVISLVKNELLEQLKNILV